jgi:hypothetical protein
VGPRAGFDVVDKTEVIYVSGFKPLAVHPTSQSRSYAVSHW